MDATCEIPFSKGCFVEAVSAKACWDTQMPQLENSAADTAQAEMDRGPQETTEVHKSGLMYATAVTLRKRAILLTSFCLLYEV